MVIKDIKMVVFDMSGTTIKDENEVMVCFKKTLEDIGIERTDAQLNAMMGWSKLEVFRTIWREETTNIELAETRARRAYTIFKNHMETYYHSHAVTPTEGAVEVFQKLREAGVKVVLDTGFYRKVVNILLEKLNWVEGVTIDGSVASDEVSYGRPAADMIQRAMQRFDITDTKQVIKIGDTPSDLQEGRAARCRYSFGITSGTHTREELQPYENDGLFENLEDFWAFLTQ